MYNGRIGFMNRQQYFYKTTTSGSNWFTIPGGTNYGAFRDIYFIDSLMGWKSNPANGNMEKTTNGGFNWITQTLPFGGIITSGMLEFCVLNKDTIWGSGGFVFYGGGRYRGILYRTIDGGSNWLFQVPDTSFGIIGFYSVQFINKRVGWGFGGKTDLSYANIHTTNGGDTTFLLGIKQISNEIPKNFKLYQNYPNPFNPKTNIKYQIVKNKYQKKSKVKLIVYNVQGKEVNMLVNEEQAAGIYEVDFSGYGYSSGVYFYQLSVDNKIIDSKKMILLK